MAVTIDWAQRIINIPLDYLTDLGGGMYELDLEQFRLDLKALESSEAGQCFTDTHIHSTEVTLAGQTYARQMQIANGYTVTFEDGQYGVNAVGANSNVLDVMNFNQVSFRGNNSAGLIVKGTGLTAEERALLRFAAQSNFRQRNQEFEAGRMISADEAVYATAQDCEDETNPLLQRTKTGVYSSSGKMTDYKVKDE